MSSMRESTYYTLLKFLLLAPNKCARKRPLSPLKENVTSNLTFTVFLDMGDHFE